MEQAVECGRGHDGVAGEDLPPVGEAFIAGQNDRLPLLVAFADGLEQEAGVGLFESEIADLIDDKQLGSG